MAGLQRARLTLQVMTSAVCSRWHTDYVTVAPPAASSTLCPGSYARHLRPEFARAWLFPTQTLKLVLFRCAGW
jgi:hypothetical protein